ncbi:hypothetical protein [Streptomyces ureilyticus]|uniref:Uncharacterized protein n=1 Tax=Streptomyces ureilyticus TaxID=1775131 RepID=A0ABX0DT51_9ACTN|nr:hypothetical protein [Streptomyces ureilyticus]NGO42287.1 hypothetical protein [Streptomyces ureilyticus]
MPKPVAQDRGVAAVGDLLADLIGNVDTALLQNKQDVLRAALGSAFLPDLFRDRRREEREVFDHQFPPQFQGGRIRGKTL